MTSIKAGQVTLYWFKCERAEQYLKRMTNLMVRYNSQCDRRHVEGVGHEVDDVPKIADVVL